jgi:CHASE3 domain sensor protein
MRLSAAEKVNAGFALALAVVVVIGIASITSIQLSLGTSDDERRTHLVVTELHSMLTTLALAEGAVRGYVITGDPSYLEPYRTANRTMGRRIAGLRAGTAEPQQLERLARLDTDVAMRLRLMDEIVEARGQFSPEAASAIVASGAGRGLMENIRATAADFEGRELQRLRERQRVAASRARVAAFVSAGGSLFTLLVVFGSALVIRRDFSERKRAEQALRDSETLLSQFMENLPIGVMVVDAAWQPRFANNAAVEILGPRVLLDTGGRPLELLLQDGAPYPEPHTPVARALDGHHATADDAYVEVADRRIPLEVSAAPIYDASGRIAYAIATFSDISCASPPPSPLPTPPRPPPPPRRRSAPHAMPPRQPAAPRATFSRA